MAWPVAVRELVKAAALVSGRRNMSRSTAIEYSATSRADDMRPAGGSEGGWIGGENEGAGRPGGVRLGSVPQKLVAVQPHEREAGRVLHVGSCPPRPRGLRTLCTSSSPNERPLAFSMTP